MGDLRAIDAASAPLRRCRTCGAEKPFTDAYYGRRVEKRRDGSTYPGTWFLDCRVCEGQRAHRNGLRKQAERRGEIAATPPVAKALKTLPLPPPPARPSLRSELERQAAAQHEKLAAKMLKLALGDGKDAAAMLKLVSAYLMGTPREASEDNGPTEFWHALLASASQRDPGADPDLDAAGADLEPDSGADGAGE